MLSSLLALTKPQGPQTVPDALMGCWRRNWIRWGAAGPLDHDEDVIWLQTPSGMGDIRVGPGQQPRDSDSSCGITLVDTTTSPYMTADWVDGTSGFAQQSVPSFPEKGWLDWQGPSLFLELAPSGAYVEQWERVDGSDTGLSAHFVAPGAATTTNLYVAGEHVFLAVRYNADAQDAQDAQGEACDGVHEFSYGRLDPSHDRVSISLSTWPHRVGRPMDLDHDWRPVSCRSFG